MDGRKCITGAFIMYVRSVTRVWHGCLEERGVKRETKNSVFRMMIRTVHKHDISVGIVVACTIECRQTIVRGKKNE